MMKKLYTLLALVTLAALFLSACSSTDAKKTPEPIKAQVTVTYTLGDSIKLAVRGSDMLPGSSYTLKIFKDGNSIYEENVMVEDANNGFDRLFNGAIGQTEISKAMSLEFKLYLGDTLESTDLVQLY